MITYRVGEIIMVMSPTVIANDCAGAQRIVDKMVTVARSAFMRLSIYQR